MKFFGHLMYLKILLERLFIIPWNRRFQAQKLRILHWNLPINTPPVTSSKLCSNRKEVLDPQPESTGSQSDKGWRTMETVHPVYLTTVSHLSGVFNLSGAPTYLIIRTTSDLRTPMSRIEVENPCRINDICQIIFQALHDYRSCFTYVGLSIVMERMECD